MPDTSPTPPTGTQYTHTNPPSGLAVRACRGHFHVIDWSNGEEGEDIALPGDPFKTAEAALDAIDRYRNPSPTPPPRSTEATLDELLELFASDSELRITLTQRKTFRQAIASLCAQRDRKASEVEALASGEVHRVEGHVRFGTAWGFWRDEKWFVFATCAEALRALLGPSPEEKDTDG